MFLEAVGVVHGEGTQTGAFLVASGGVWSLSIGIEETFESDKEEPGGMEEGATVV